MTKVSDKIAKRYARALFMAYPHEILDGVRESLNRAAALFRENESLLEVVGNPAYPSAQRSAVVEEVFSRVRPDDHVFTGLARELFANGRIGGIERVAKLFSDMVDELRKFLTISVTSAFDISGDERARLENDLKQRVGGMASVSWATNPDLIGGLRIQMGDKLLDGSIAGSLEKLRAELAAN